MTQDPQPTARTPVELTKFAFITDPRNSQTSTTRAPILVTCCFEDQPCPYSLLYETKTTLHQREPRDDQRLFVRSKITVGFCRLSIQFQYRTEDIKYLILIPTRSSSQSDEMPTVFSKFADGEISPHDLQSEPVQGQDEKSESHTQLPSSDVYQVSRAQLEQLKAILEEVVAEKRLIDSKVEAIKQHSTLVEGRMPELFNPQSTRTEMGLPEASRPPRADTDMTQSKSKNWTDKQAGLTLDNGQLRLKIKDWRSSSPMFCMENNSKGNPKCDLDAVIESPELVRVDFKIPTDYPEGMMGIMRSIETLFTSPKKIAMSNVETGSAPACREATNPKRDSYYMKWTAPWESSGCRVSWMKVKEKSSTLRFKFVSVKDANPGEQMMVTVDERDHFYWKISKKDPYTYGKWMALPVRIWLRIQCLLSGTSGIGNGLFGKLVVDDVPASSSKKKKNKGKKSSKRPAKRAREHSTAEEGTHQDEKSNASVVPSPGQSVLVEEHTMEKVGSQELTKGLTEEELPQDKMTQHGLTEQEEESTKESTKESTREESTREESTKQESAYQMSPEKELTKRVSTLTIDTRKSNERFKGKRKGKRTPTSSSSDTGKRDANQVSIHTTQNMTEQRDGLLPEVHDIAPQDVLTEQQLAAVAGQQTVNASPVPITPIDSTTPSYPSFETARTHLSPRTPFPSSSLSPFFTPTSALPKIDEDPEEEVVQAEGNEPAKVSDELCLTPQGPEVELRRPVSDNRGEVWFSDSEEDPVGHEAQVPVLRRRQSFDVANLGPSEGQKTTSSSQMADPPSTSVASSVLSTADSAGSTTYDSSSSCTVLADDQTPAESSQHDKKRAYKKKKRQRRKCKNLMKRQETRDADAEFPVSNASSQEDGVEGRSPSPPESFEDDEPTPTAKQFGNIGPPTPEPQWDLSMIGILCQKADCQVACGFADGGSVVCPKCGPFSLVRYCGKDHLWEDAKMHWGVCGKLQALHQNVAGSIPYDDLVGPPMLPSLHQWDNPERHRQALWFSSARDRGDYFVFAEWDDLVRAEDAPASHLALRCSPRIAHIVRFEDAKEKDRFRRCLAICLFAAVEHPDLVDYLYRLVRDWMRAHNMWASDKDMDGMLRYQMGLEMGGNIHQSRLGLRHACETEWVGADRRHCEDPTCVSERLPTLLGNHRMGLGFRRVCEALESNYWILRAHRATHPSVSDVEARTRGAGFSEVLTVDRRTFRRGVGWDGAGTGPMEVEIPWSG